MVLLHSILSHCNDRSVSSRLVENFGAVWKKEPKFRTRTLLKIKPPPSTKSMNESSPQQNWKLRISNFQKKIVVALSSYWQRFFRSSGAAVLLGFLPPWSQVYVFREIYRFFKRITNSVISRFTVRSIYFNSRSAHGRSAS